MAPLGFAMAGTKALEHVSWMSPLFFGRLLENRGQKSFYRMADSTLKGNFCERI